MISRHRNLTVLILVLFAQVVGLAVQVKHTTRGGSTRLIRLWGVSLIAPAENAAVHAQNSFYGVWRDYFYLRNVRQENVQLQQENLRLRLEQVRMAEDAGQAQRLQALMKFKEQFISATVAAQVIGSSGAETSRIIYLDKGADDGIKPDMPVIVPSGIVGKVINVLPNTAQVQEINDQYSGVGALLEKSRLQGILKGTSSGETVVQYIMSDEKVDVGEMVVTSGGDRIFPKGLPIGRVVKVSPGPEMFLNIRVQPAARLDRCEEVLVITKVDEKQPELLPEAPTRAADILAQRLPGIPVRPPDVSSAGATSPPLALKPANNESGNPMSGYTKPVAGQKSPALHASAPGLGAPADTANARSGSSVRATTRVTTNDVSVAPRPGGAKQPKPGVAGTPDPHAEEPHE